MLLDKVSVTCPQCEKSRLIHQDTARQYRRQGRVPPCIACGNRNRPPVARTTPLCRHCNKRHTCRPKGLCWTCSQTVWIREQYESESVFGRRGVPDPTGPLPLPDGPTTAPPGSLEKQAVMQARAANRQAIFHPFDSRYPDDPRPVRFLERRAA